MKDTMRLEMYVREIEYYVDKYELKNIEDVKTYLSRLSMLYKFILDEIERLDLTLDLTFEELDELL